MKEKYFNKLCEKVGKQKVYAILTDVLRHYCSHVTSEFLNRHTTMLAKKHLCIKTGKQFRSLRKAVVYAEVLRNRLGVEKLEFLNSMGIKYL